MEVIVGEEEGIFPETQLKDFDVNKTIVPIVWAVVYGRTLSFFFNLIST